VPLIPKHTVYAEPFAGGAAVMFAKPWPDVTNTDHYREVINDIDGDLVNFYRQLRDNGSELCRLLSLTLHSEEEYRTAKDLDFGDDLERARRYYVNIQQSFSYKLHGGWSRGKSTRNDAATWMNKIDRLPEYIDRMRSVNISNTCALKFIEQWDSPQTFFYCDPPYPGSDQGHYSGYTLDEYRRLIENLSDIKGSFILSNYEQPVDVPDNWEKFEFGATCTADKNTTKRTKRTEVVYRRFRKGILRPELKKLLDSGKYDCFTGAQYFSEKGVPMTFEDLTFGDFERKIDDAD